MDRQIQYSIIIPHKNIPDLLNRCLSSIPVNDRIQVIIVDDDSDSIKVDFDNFTGKMLSNVQVILTKEAKGAGYARNVGLKYAVGEWLIFADSDDFFNSCFLESIDRYRNSDADVVYFSATSVDSETMESATRHVQIHNATHDYDVSNPKSVTNIKYSNWEPWSKMFNHNYVKRNNFYFDEVMVGNDLGFVLKAGHYSRKIEVDKSPIYCVTYRKESLTYEDSKTAFDNRYYAVLLANKYMKEFKREDYMTPVFPLIHSGMKYGIFKVVEMILKAIKHKSNLLYGSRGYLVRLYRARKKH